MFVVFFNSMRCSRVTFFQSVVITFKFWWLSTHGLLVLRRRMLHGSHGGTARWLLPITAMHLVFYQSVSSINLWWVQQDLAAGGPSGTSITCEQMNAFLTKLASKFLPVSSPRQLKQNLNALIHREEDQLQLTWMCASMLTIYAVTYNILFASDIMASLLDLVQSCVCTNHQKMVTSAKYKWPSFIKLCKDIYARAMEYALDNLPIKDHLPSNAGFVNFKSRENAKFPKHTSLWKDRY